MPRQQTLSCAAHIVCVRCYKWEKEDVGLSAWRDVIVSVLIPMCMLFSCVCMREPVRKWPNHHLLQPGESRPINNLQGSPLLPAHSPASPSLCCDWTRGLVQFDLQHGQQGSFRSPVKLRWGRVTSISVSRRHASYSSASGRQQHERVAWEHANMLTHTSPSHFRSLSKSL